MVWPPPPTPSVRDRGTRALSWRCPPLREVLSRTHGAPDGGGRPGPFDPARHLRARCESSFVHDWSRRQRLNAPVTTGPGPAMSTAGPRRRVLVVDDEPSIVDAVATALRYEGFDVLE